MLNGTIVRRCAHLTGLPGPAAGNARRDIRTEKRGLAPDTGPHAGQMITNQMPGVVPARSSRLCRNFLKPSV